MGQRTDGDLRMEAYSAERAFVVSEHEPDLGIGVRIEYVIGCDGEEAITEVKEFAWESWPIKGSGTYSEQQMLKPIRGQIHEAARKLKKATRLGKPLIAVITDPKGVMADRTGPMQMIGAIVGDVSIRIPVGPSGPVGPAEVVAGRNGELAREHAHVSAVLMVHKPFGSDHHIGHWYITNSPGAVPLPEAFVIDPRDGVWEFVDGEGYRMRDFKPERPADRTANPARPRWLH
jgi:hypothetical protein